jgi:deleted-in-malignant-brain-tumors protein 1
MNYVGVDADSRNNPGPVVGVNAGDGANFHLHPNSQTSHIYNIEHEPGNTGELGQWVYRIDVISNKTKCIRGVRRQLASTGSKRSNIFLIPNVGSMFGGTAVRIAGPCIRNAQEIQCSFGNQVVDGIFLPDEQQFLCVTPVFTYRKVDTMRFTLSLNSNGERIIFSSIFHTIFPNGVHISSGASIQAGETVHINWDPEFLAVRKPWNYNIDIDLYKVLDDTSLQYIQTLLRNIPNNGSAYITIPDLNDNIVGFFNVSAHSQEFFARRKRQTGITPPLPPNTGGITPIPGGDINCTTWCESQPDGIRQSLINDLDVEPCPATVHLARLDRFFRNWKDSELKCPLLSSLMMNHSEANVCYIQVLPRPKNPGNQCCYTEDGNLCLQEGCGGRVNKVSPGLNGQFCLQHMLEDIGNINCEDYPKKRPIANLPPRNYVPPGRLFGDPHIVTLDGHKYTFNGKGEFTLIETRNREFVLQGRMEEAVNDANEEVLATAFSAIVAKEANSDAFQAEVGAGDQLVVLVNGEQIRFDGVQALQFRNVTVSDQGNSTISASFSFGAYIELKQENGIISEILFSLANRFRKQTQGLMGNYNGDASDDLIPKGSRVPISLESSIREIHRFGVTWIITSAENSLFVYSQSHSFADYFAPWFTPIFQPAFSDPILEQKARDICGNDSFCLFDIAATKRVEIGNCTKKVNDDVRKLVRYSYPIVCNPKCQHGVCVKNNTCTCHHGYRGKLCSEIDYVPCAVNICQNGGNCSKVGQREQCNCTTGFIGLKCESVKVKYTVTYYNWYSFGILLSWSAISPLPIEMFRITVYEVTVKGIEIVSTEQVGGSSRTSLISSSILRTGHGERYYIQLESRINGEYVSPDGFYYGNEHPA